MRRVALILALLACRGGEKSARAPTSGVHEDAAKVAQVASGAPPACPGDQTLCADCLGGTARSCTTVAKNAPTLEKGPWYQRGCEGGDADGCDGLARAYELGGMGVAKDHDAAVKADQRKYELSSQMVEKEQARCGPGDEEACVDAAIALIVGKRAPKDVDVGTTMLFDSCKRHYARACKSLSEQEELPVAKRAKFAKAACTAGAETSCGDLLGVYGKPPLAPNEDKFVVGQLEKMCKAKTAAACSVLAGVFWTTNKKRAATEIATACKLEQRYCADADRLRRGEPYVVDLGPVPTVDKR